MNAPLDSAVAPYVLTHTEQGVCRLTLNRGERYNPLSRAMIAALQAAKCSCCQARSAWERISFRS